MATIGTRINSNGEEEIIITNINNDLNGLISAIDEFRKDAPFSRKKIFITESLNINRKIIDRDINFSDCVFEKMISFIETTFKGKINFKSSIFQDETDFSSVVFKNNINFSRAIFQGKINFYNSKFMKNVNFLKSNFQNKAHFLKVNFQENISFDNVEFQDETYFSGAIFKKESYFLGATFQNKVEFRSCKFHLLGFINTIFNKLVDFSLSIFISSIEFDAVNFMDSANFSNTTFKQEAKFTDCKVDSKTLISFQCATFKKGLDISTSNFNICKLSFLGIKIENIRDALLSNHYNFKANDDTPVLSPHQRFRETFRFIKNSLYAENNQIEGLEFHKKEMEVYGKELESKDDEYWQEKIILWLNKKSNNYGTSWLRGVGFTAVWALGILGIILGITIFENQDIIPAFYHWGILQQILKAYIEIINIAKWTDIKPLGYELSGFGLFFLFVGRIFIGYGYYQTIQAFRKYGK